MNSSSIRLSKIEKTPSKTCLTTHNSSPISVCLDAIHTSTQTAVETQACKKRRIELVPSSPKNLELILDQWIEEASEAELNSRLLAKGIVEDFLSNPCETTVSFCNLQLSTLPNIWEYSEFTKRLKKLNLSENKLSTIPDSIGKLKALTTLHLYDNHLQEIPQSLTNLNNLTWLNVGKNEITTIPGYITNLKKIQILSLSGNKIKEIPEFIQKLNKLKEIHLNYNEIEEIPEFIGNITSLTQILLSNNQIKCIPQSIENLKDLKILNLSDNQALTKLCNGILSLPLSCSIDIQNCNLSLQDLRRLDTYYKSPQYTGPSISYVRTPLNTDLASLDREVLDIVAIWEQEAPEVGRKYAKTMIKNFIESPGSTSLDFCYLTISSLPDIWDYPQFSKRLSTLNLSQNNLQKLPRSINFLINLTNLDLSMNQLQELPPYFNKLSSLRKLDLSHNELESLPESIGELASLQSLSAINNKLRNIPDSIGNLTDLQLLNLSENELETLPESIGQLTSLKYLLVYNNKIQRIPDSIGNLTDLQLLNFFRNKLEVLPESIRRLSSLREFILLGNRLRTIPGFIVELRNLTLLDLSHNRLLMSLPNEILQLPESCILGLQSTGLSRQVLLHLWELASAPDYVGPNCYIESEILDSPEIDSRTVNELLDFFYAISEKERVSFPEEFTNNPELQDWLARISYMADFNSNQETKRTSVAKKVLEFLELAADPAQLEFHDLFFGSLAGATRSCGDSMTLSLLHLEIAKQLALLEKTDLQGLATLLIKGSWILNQLEEFARNKIKALPLVDEIEVYLAYPIKLKEVLEIPITMNEMLYFSCSELTEEDLTLAEKSVVDTLSDKKKTCTFLTSQKRWEEALDSLGLLENLKRVREENAERAMTDEQYLTIQADYQKGLEELTLEKLSEYGFIFPTS